MNRAIWVQLPTTGPLSVINTFMHKPNSIFEAAHNVLRGEVLSEAAVSPAVAKLVKKYDAGFLDELDYDDDDADIKKQVRRFQTQFKITHRHIAVATQEFIEGDDHEWSKFVADVKKATSSFLELDALDSDGKVIYFV